MSDNRSLRGRSIDTIDQDSRVILNLADLLCVLLAQPDADTAIDGIWQVAHVIADRARAIRDELDPQKEEAAAA